APLSATPVLLRAAPHALSQTSTTRDAHDRGAPGGAGPRCAPASTPAARGRSAASSACSRAQDGGIDTRKAGGVRSPRIEPARASRRAPREPSTVTPDQQGGGP